MAYGTTRMRTMTTQATAANFSQAGICRLLCTAFRARYSARFGFGDGVVRVSSASGATPGIVLGTFSMLPQVGQVKAEPASASSKEKDRPQLHGKVTVAMESSRSQSVRKTERPISDPYLHTPAAGPQLPKNAKCSWRCDPKGATIFPEKRRARSVSD